MTARYLAIDPGHTSGYALFDNKGNIVEYGQFTLEELNETIKRIFSPDLEHVIVEDYRNHGWTQQKKWSRNETSKVIGKLELMADLHGVPVTLQSNTVKGIGYMWAGLEPPKNHSISHQFDAYAHGVYWLQTNGIRPVGKSIPKSTNKENSND